MRIPRQLRLWHLLAVTTACGFAFQFFVSIMIPLINLGTLSDLTLAERKVISALQQAGLPIRERFT